MKAIWRSLGVIMALVVGFSTVGTRVYAAETVDNGAIVSEQPGGSSDASDGDKDSALEDAVTDDDKDEKESDSSDQDLEADDKAKEQDPESDSEDPSDETEADATDDAAVDETEELTDEADADPSLVSEEVIEEPEKDQLLKETVKTRENKHLYLSGSEVSRISWLRTLIDKFDLDLSDEAYPDNYYTDIDENYTYYREAMIAVRYGFIDVMPGEEFDPDGAATREFVAHTLNMCLGFVVEEGDYSYSDSDSTEYPMDAEAALRFGFLDTIDGAFVPGNSVTTAEVSEICSVIDEIRENESVSGSNTYKYKEGVVVLPSDTDIVTEDKGVIRIVGGTSLIETGDIFGVVYDGAPLAWKAKSISSDGGDLIVTTDTVEMEDAFEEINFSASGNIDPEDIQTVSPTARVYYVVGGSAENNFEDGQQYSSYDEVGDQEISAVAIEDDVLLGAEYGSNVVDGLRYSFRASITNEKWDYAAHLNSAHVAVDFDVVLSVSIEGDLAKMLDVDLNLCKFEIYPGIFYETSLLFNLKGSIRGEFVEHVHAGAYWDGWFQGVRFERWMYDKSYTVTGELKGSIGFEFALSADYLIMSAEIYARLGTEATLKIVEYRDNLQPHRCTDLSLYMFAIIGYEMNVFGQHVADDEVNLFTMTNSPVKVCAHWEDGTQVDACTAPDRYKEADANKCFPGYGGSSRGVGYFAPLGSRYYYNGKSSTVGSVIIYTYDKDEDSKTCTITGYKGYSENMIIPKELDGYTVVKIADRAFKDNKVIRSVSMPDSVTELGSGAFQNCTNLSAVTLSANLKTIKCSSVGAFQGCTALSEIKIPKSLTESTKWNDTGGTFKDTGLKTVQFEDGVTMIPEGLFANCSSLEEIVIPDTVTEIGHSAFYNDPNLRKVEFSDSLLLIDAYAFSTCGSLEEVKLPECVTRINSGAFRDCTKLSSANLPKSLVTMGCNSVGVFQGCSSLTEITIPKSLTDTSKWNYSGGIFKDTGLKTVRFEDGVTQIPEGLFANCSSLEEITIPDTVTEIKHSAFCNDPNLRKVRFSNSLLLIEAYAFLKCVSLEEVKLPDCVTKIDSGAFQDCTKLSSVNLPKSLKTLGCNSIGVFQGCSLLTEITIPKSLTDTTKWNDSGGTFKDTGLKTVRFEDGVSVISEGLFANCSSLEEIVIPDTVTEIYSSAFYNATALKTATLSNSLTTINENAFNSCTALAQVSMPDTVTLVGQAAFEDCTSMESIKLSENIKFTSSAKRVFYGCSSLKEITVPASLQNMGTQTFEGCSSLEKAAFKGSLETIGTNCFKDCTSLKSIEFPDGLTSIGADAYYNCDALTEVNIPDGVTSIGASAFAESDKISSIEVSSSVQKLGDSCFEGCDLLTDVKLGNGITAIPSKCFYNLNSLEKIIIPMGVTSIGSDAFYNCVKLSAVTIPSTVSSISGTSFTYLNRLTVYGVKGSYAETWANENGVQFVENTKHAEGVSLNKTELILSKGASERLGFSVTPLDHTDGCVWESEDTSIATVSDNGTVKAVGIGETVVAVYVGDEAFAECTVSVRQPVSGITLSKTTLTMDAYDTVQLTATVKPDNAYNKAITWQSTDESVATVDETGFVTAIAKGTATISATANDGSGKSGSCKVTVQRDVIKCASWGELESEHKYTSNSDLMWRYTLEGAEKLFVTFDAQTAFVGSDYLYVYDGNKNKVGQYGGDELSGKTITVPGDTIILNLVTDNARVAWGFKVVNVTDELEVADYSITYVNNGHGETPQKAENVSRLPSVLPQLSETGYIFGGWYTRQTKDASGNPVFDENDKAVAGSKLTGNLTLYAKWTAVTVVVTFDSGAGKLTDGSSVQKEVTYGEKYGDLPVAELEGSKFIGWFTDAEGGDAITAATIVRSADGHTLYARYKEAGALMMPYVCDSSGVRLADGAVLDEGTKLSLRSDDLNVAIYYALNGAEITEDDAHLYKSAITVSDDITISAYAKKQGYNNSPVMTMSFTVKASSEDWGEIKEGHQKAFADADEVPEGIWVAGMDNDHVYTGNAVTFDDTLDVYYHKKLLIAGQDYTVKYSNNVKASTEKSKATVTVTGKGNYSGSRKEVFMIRPVNLGDGNAVIADVEKEYNGKIQKAASTVMYYFAETGRYVTLKSGTDFTYDYSELGAEVGVYTVTVRGKGNYTGAATYTETIFSKGEKIDVSKLKVSSVKAQQATGYEIMPELVVTDTANQYVLAAGEDGDYEVEFFNNIEVGTATAVIKGTGVDGGSGHIYTGTRTITFKITGIPISKAKLYVDPYTFTGNQIEPDITVTYRANKNSEEETLDEPYDFTATFSSNINKGKGKITLKGKGRFTGSVTKTFAINACKFADGDVYVESDEFPEAYTSNNISDELGEYEYTKGGVKPEFTVKYGDQILNLGKDFTVKYSKNNQVGGLGKNRPYLVITGKGNYNGKFTRYFDIIPSSLDNAEVVATDIKWANKVGICKPSITVYDSNGAKLAAGKDYDKNNIEYIYESDSDIMRDGILTHVTGGESYVYLKQDLIPKGTEIRVIVHGKGNYDTASTQSAVFTYVDELISKATIKLRSGSLTYTGSAIRLNCRWGPIR